MLGGLNNRNLLSVGSGCWKGFCGEGCLGEPVGCHSWTPGIYQEPLACGRIFSILGFIFDILTVCVSVSTFLVMIRTLITLD